jgi:hypothetical protein
MVVVSVHLNWINKKSYIAPSTTFSHHPCLQLPMMNQMFLCQKRIVLPETEMWVWSMKKNYLSMRLVPSKLLVLLSKMSGPDGIMTMMTQRKRMKRQRQRQEAEADNGGGGYTEGEDAEVDWEDDGNENGNKLSALDILSKEFECNSVANGEQICHNFVCISTYNIIQLES